MACNNKDFHKGCKFPYCMITNGECQFITHEEICPMHFWNFCPKPDPITGEYVILDNDEYALLDDGDTIIIEK